MQYDDWKLMVLIGDQESRMGSNTPIPHIVSGNNGEDLLSPELFNPKHSPYIGLDWEDFGVPYLSKHWWATFVEDISKIDGDIAVGCTGGHGRTGTALAIIKGMADPSDELDPVLWLREKYCQQIVESASQVNYIERMLDRKLYCGVRKSKFGAGYLSGFDYQSDFWGLPAYAKDATKASNGGGKTQTYADWEDAVTKEEEDDVDLEVDVVDEFDDLERGKTYRPITNAAGDVVWQEVLSVFERQLADAAKLT